MEFEKNICKQFLNLDEKEKAVGQIYFIARPQEEKTSKDSRLNGKVFYISKPDHLANQALDDHRVILEFPNLIDKT